MGPTAPVWAQRLCRSLCRPTLTQSGREWWGACDTLYVCACACVRTCVCVCSVHACVCVVCMRACVHACVCVHACTCVCACMCACMQCGGVRMRCRYLERRWRLRAISSTIGKDTVASIGQAATAQYMGLCRSTGQIFIIVTISDTVMPLFVKSRLSFALPTSIMNTSPLNGE